MTSFGTKRITALFLAFVFFGGASAERADESSIEVSSMIQKRAAQNRSGGHQPGGSCTTRPCAAPLRGNAGFTTVDCVEPSDHFGGNSQGDVMPVGSSIFGPLENGFTSQQDSGLTRMGCDPPSLGYSDGGRDTKTAVEEMAYTCQVELPRQQMVGGTEMWVSLLDECGGHTNQYHFHESFSCCYEESGTHSPQIGEGVYSNDDKLYGKWEDFSLGSPDGLPLLDACGGHFGPTPESPNEDTYHYHVQGKAPFTFGCYGPNPDGTQVTVEQCRALYPTCEGTETSLEIGYPTSRTVKYDIDCPCYDGDGSNLGTEPFKKYVESESTTDPTPTSTPAPTLDPTPPPTPAPTPPPTPSPTPASTPASGTCFNWCPRNSHLWETKCNWSGCNGCSDCESVTTTTTTTLANCYAWCPDNVHPWSSKCNWAKCRGCGDCAQSTPAPTAAPTAEPTAAPTAEPTAEPTAAALPNCDSSCAGKPAPWTKKCSYPLCRGCAQCLNTIR